jgi:hypothetical protein
VRQGIRAAARHGRDTMEDLEWNICGLRGGDRCRLLLPLLYKPTELRWRLKCLQRKLATPVFAELLFFNT